MNEIAERTRTTKTPVRPLSKADKELNAMKAYIKKVTSSKKQAVSFLERSGIIDKKGVLAKQYRS